MQTNSERNTLITAVLMGTLFMCCCAGGVTAQVVQTGIIDGLVVDRSGDPVPGAFVTIESRTVNAQKFSTISDIDGVFRVPGLPPGVYYITAQLEGYIQDGDLRVNLRVNQIQRVVLTLREGYQRDRPQPVRAAFLNSLFDDPFRESLPVFEQSRFSEDIRFLKPEWAITTWQDGRNLVLPAGMAGGQTSVLLDGIQFKDPFDGGLLLPLDRILHAEVEISTRFLLPETLGSSGRFSFSTGGQRSGIHGALSLGAGTEIMLTSGQETTALSNNPVWGGIILSNRFNDNDASIILSASGSSHGYNSFVGPYAGRRDRSQFLLGRYITAVSETSELQVSAIFSDFDQLNANTFSLDRWSIQPEADELVTDDESRTSRIIDFVYQQRLSDNILISYSLNYSRLDYERMPASGDTSQSRQIDQQLNILSSGSLSGTWMDREIERLGGSAGIEFFLDEITGTHQISLGVDAEYNESLQEWGYNGGVSRELRQGEVVARHFFYQFGEDRIDPSSNATLTRFSVHARDNWLINPRLMVNIGIRFDSTNIENSTTQVLDWDAISPRLGIGFDFFNDGSLILRGGGGRYFDRALIQRSMSDPYGRASRYDFAVMRRLDLIPRVPGGEFTLERYGFDADWRPADTGTEPPKTDEAFVSLEYSPEEDVLFSLAYSWRKTNDILEDSDYAVSEDGRVLIGSFTRWSENQAFDSQGNAYSWYDLETIPGNELSQILFWQNDDRLFRVYHQLLIRAEASLSNSLTVRSAYTWNRIRGNIDTTGEDLSSRSTSQNDPNHFANAEGFLSSHRQHIARLLLTWRITGLSAAASFVYKSGAPYDRMLFNPWFGALDYSIRADPRGEVYRYDDQFTLNARLEKSLFFDGSRIVAILEVRNMLDSRAVTSVETRDITAFGTPLEYQLPRTVEAGIKYQF